MIREFSILSIKHLAKGWDAEISSVGRSGMLVLDRVRSEDGFHWRFQPIGGTVPRQIQNELTRSVGDMVALGAREVIF